MSRFLISHRLPWPLLFGGVGFGPAYGDSRRKEGLLSGLTKTSGLFAT